MAATQQNGAEEPGARRWTEPDPQAVTAKIAELRKLANPQFAAALAAFIATAEDDHVTGYAIRSPELARKARRLLPRLVEDPDRYLEAPAGESSNQYHERLRRFRVAAEREGMLLYYVTAGMVARRGHRPPEPNPRARARRRLADEFPERFLELLREEQELDAERAEEQARERAAARAAGS
ncbi:hypothetical protein ACFVHW_04495 [Streptomyces sp. NPDC127110]|uniref:hypothetical protein n=1 Tax=Streptomyces sp. NPDC127110 TaxID=3345362 RepID=UPI0036263852